jgi:hypothetical protein
MKKRRQQESTEVIVPLEAGCTSCDVEPLTDLPDIIRRGMMQWQFWQLHIAFHNFGRECLKLVPTVERLKWKLFPRHWRRRSIKKWGRM